MALPALAPRDRQPVAAVPLLTRTLADFPDDAGVRLELARAHHERGADHEVLALYPDAASLPATAETLGILLASSARRFDDLAAAAAIVENLSNKGCDSEELLELSSEIYSARGETSRAEAVLAAGCKRHPKSWKLALSLSELHAKAGRIFDARQELAGARALAPAEESLYLASARLELADERPADSVAHIETFLRMSPKDPRGHHLRGQAHLAMDHPREAEDCFRRALRMDPEFIDSCLALGRLLLRQGRGPEARKLLESFATTASRREHVLGDLASVYLAENRPREAEAYLRELVESGPQGRPGLRPLAELLLGQKRDREALEVVSQSGDGAGKMLGQLAEWLRSHGEHRRSRLVYERALSLGAERATALLGIARCHGACGQLGASRQRYEDLLKVAPGSAEAGLELARLLAQQAAMLRSGEKGRGAGETETSLMDAALELLRRFWENCQSDASALNLFASLALRRDRHADAGAAVRRSLELDPRQAQAHALQGDLHLWASDQPKALESYLTSLALDPGLEEAACKAIAFLEETGHLVQARVVMEKVVDKRPLSRRGRLALARICSRLGDQKAASMHWEAAARTAPLESDDTLGLVAAYVSMGRYADAERINGAQLAADPKGLDGLLLAGDIARAAGRLAESRLRFDQAARLHPRSGRCPAKLSELYLCDGRLQDALFQIRHAIDLEPAVAAFHEHHGKVLLELNRHEAACQAFECALEKPGPHQTRTRLALARAYRKLDNRRLAVETLQDVARGGECAGEAMEQLAELHFERGDWPRASEAYEQLRAFGRALDAGAHERLALCYAKMGMGARGAAALRELSASGRPSVELVLELARAYLRQGVVRDALGLLMEHVAAQPPAGRARLHLEMARIHLKQGDRNAGEKGLRAALELRPQDADAQNELAVFFEETGKFEAMRQLFGGVVQSYPSDARAHCHLGNACLRLGHGKEAREAFTHAVKLDYNLFAAHAGLARSSRQQGDVPAAIEEYRKALFLSPRNGRLVFELATAFAEDGRAPQAAAQFEKVLELEAASSPLAAAAREHLQKTRMR